MLCCRDVVSGVKYKPGHANLYFFIEFCVVENAYHGGFQYEKKGLKPGLSKICVIWSSALYGVVLDEIFTVMENFQSILIFC